MGAEKKPNSSGRSSKRTSKAQGSGHTLSSGTNDMAILKQFLVDKTNSVSKH